MLEDKSPLAYCRLVHDALQYWLDMHTKAECWAEEWAGEDIQYSFQACLEKNPLGRGYIGNNYFRFDWGTAAIRRVAKQHAEEFIYCGECGVTEEGYHDCPRKVRKATLSEVADLYLDLGYDENIPNDILSEALEEGFTVYRKALKDITASVEEEIIDVLKRIHQADNNADLIQAVMWGTQVYHVNGSIMGDYTYRVPSDFSDNIIDSIRNNGLESVWSSEEVKEFLESEFESIS